MTPLLGLSSSISLEEYFTNIPLVYNGTSITCIAPGEEGGTASLLIQGSSVHVAITQFH